MAPSQALAEQPIHSARFEIVRRLGGGGMGIVYEAVDRRRQERVALKTMRSPSAKALLRFKNEFRALAGLHHPNLVQLKELIEERGHWFFTMELVDGCNFQRWIAEDEPPPAHDTLVSVAPSDLLTDPSAVLPLFEPDAPSLDTAPMPPGAPPGARFNEPRLRAGFAQMIEGLAALHRAGHVHRDIKPSNVLVGRDGRVVILDFGLVTPLLAEGDGHARRSSVAGTFAYMAPEHAAGLQVSEAADWYSCGVVLYQALTGRLPFATPAVLAGPAARTPPSPRSLVPSTPGDLDELCMELLSQAPELRPGAAEILRWLRVTPAAVEPPVETPTFVGRARELGLVAELMRARGDDAIGVIVEGPAGTGKSALLSEVGDRCRRGEPPALVLSGRCHERESLPYKAVDGIVDALSRQMSRLAPEEAAALLPRQIGALAQVFPVLLRVEAIARAPQARESLKSADPHQRRSRAFAALRELLARLCDRGPVVIAIDDVQWTDDDSLTLLAEVLRPPEPPPVILLLGLREAPAAVDAAALTARLPLPLRRLPLGPLGADEAAALARAHLGGVAANDTMVAEIVAEAQGQPLFVRELARYARNGRRHAPTLEEAIASRFAELSGDERALFEVLALAARPISLAIVESVLGASRAATETAAASLVRGRLVAQSGELYAPLHDRVAAAMLQRSPAMATARLHERLATALEASGRYDPETLAAHWLGAGRDERASTLLLQAASEAADALAFARAAELYERAWALLPETSAERPSVAARLGDALRSAGRVVDAAHAYRRAAALCDGSARVDRLRRAAECYLRGGCVDEGMVAQREVLALVGMRMPRRPIPSLLWRRAQLALRGRHFAPRDEADIPADELLRVDVCGSAGNGIAVVDPLLAALFQTRHLLLALAAGEPARVCQALVTEAIAAAARGGRARPHVERLLGEARALAEALPAVKPTALLLGGSGIAALLGGDWARAAQQSDASAQLLRERCDGLGWELGSVELFALLGRVYEGRFAELASWLPSALRDADTRGDLHTMVSFRTGHAALIWLAADDPSRARREVDEAGAARQQHWVMQRAYFDLFAGAHIDLYEGRAVEALARLRDGWSALERSYLLHLEFIRVIMLDLRARAALANARPKEALADARTLERSGAAWARPLAALVRAGAAALQQRSARADAELADAERGFALHGMRVHEAAARRRRGQRTGGADGELVVAVTDDWLRGRGVRNPDAFARLLAPGFSR